MMDVRTQESENTGEHFATPRGPRRKVRTSGDPLKVQKPPSTHPLQGALFIMSRDGDAIDHEGGPSRLHMIFFRVKLMPI